MKRLKKLYPTHFLQFGVVWVYEYAFAGALSAPYIIHTALNAISPAAWAQMPPPPLFFLFLPRINFSPSAHLPGDTKPIYYDCITINDFITSACQ